MFESNQESSPAAHSTDQPTGHAVQVNIRLTPVEQSGQAIFSNFTVARRGPGTVFVDFGFLEPNALNSVIRRAQSGEKVPEGIGGQLACRMALNLDTAAQLAQQLNQLLQAARKAQAPDSQPAEETTTTSSAD